MAGDSTKNVTRLIGRLTGQNGDRHGSVHEKQHIEEQESQIAKYFGAVVPYVVVQRADQERHQDVSEQSKVHESLRGRTRGLIDRS